MVVKNQTNKQKQRNMFQMKEKQKIPEKELSEMEAKDLQIQNSKHWLLGYSINLGEEQIPQ